MADTMLKSKIKAALKSGVFCDADDLVDVSDGVNGNVHLVVVSRKFDGRHMKEKNDMIWDELERRLLAEEWGRVSLTVGVSPEEVKAS